MSEADAIDSVIRRERHRNGGDSVRAVVFTLMLLAVAGLLIAL